MPSAPDFSIVNKRFLLTGAGGGIGTAIVNGLLASGARVLGTDIVAPTAISHENYVAKALDVTDTEQVAALAAEETQIDCVIHLAGRLSRWTEHEPDTFQQIVDIHLFGCARLAHSFRPHLKARRGCMINIGSMYSFFGAPQVPAYAAAKTAVLSLTKSLAIAYAEDGIRVNAIAPGWIRTEMSRGGRENPEFNRIVVARIPNHEWAEPEDLVGTIVFLASPAAALVNGVTIPVDGGYSAS